MSTVTKLKELYVKLGGKLSDVKGIQTDEEMIEKIAKTKLGIKYHLPQRKMMESCRSRWKSIRQ